MAAQGEFELRSDGHCERKVFVIRNTDLEIGDESISSEWTTDSEAERAEQAAQQDKKGSRGILEEKQNRKKRKKRAWRLRYLLQRRHESSESSSSSHASSSTSSDSSSSTDGGEIGSFKRQRQQVQQQWNLLKGRTSNFSPPADSPPPLAPRSVADEQPSRHGELYWFEAPKKYRSFALAPAFLRQEDIEAIAAAAKHASVKEINDRKGYLAFKHRVWRFELQLRSLSPELYARLMALMRNADEAQWQRLCAKSKKVYPEVEYIEYDVEEMGEPCFIEPHVDNKSAVTLVAMLSAPDAYVGGRSCFRRAAGSRGHREVTLQKGDVVLFRGEKLVHWITPVTAGRRVILQIELSRV
ncbi:unnamed protein product [Symbiodinium pilosum]|uniref:Uncharacterized protein n=1 Tax=Symbiodinium pilosum TaxID=2952 RepID=A0A812JHB2_SYMPI|nr:unnamed protein product [Symbiodinium pilosum]